MITLKVVPTATATQQTLLVECEERLCKPFCTSGSVQPIGSISYQTGAVSVLNGIALVPLIATIVITTPNANECGCCSNQIFVEQTLIPFTATTENNITITAGASVSTTASSVKCCKAYGVKVLGSVEITIA